MVALIAVSGYSSGLFIEFAAFGDDSKVQRLIDNGTFDEKWVPFIRTAQMYNPSGYLDSVSIDSASWSFLKNAYLLETLVGDIDSAYLDFTIESTRVSPTVGHDFFRNEITECIFITDDTLNFETCVICQLTDINGVVVADGRTDVPNISPNADPIVIQIDNFWVEDARDVRNIHDVIIAVCDGEEGGEGCTPGYWKQPQHFGSWPTSGTGSEFIPFVGGSFVTINPVVIENGGTKFSAVFGQNIVITVGGDPHTEILDPTLLQALKATGFGVGPLARHATAAWLNAESTVMFDFSSTEVITKFNTAFLNGDFNEAIKNQLQDANESDCPLGLSPLESEVTAFSETGGVDPAGYTGATDTPFEKKMYAISELNNLLTQTSDPITIAELNTAITDLDAIVNNLDYWVDDYHLDIVTGSFVLDNSKEATISLIAITTSTTESDTFKLSVENVINELVAADLLLAQIAVDDVTSCGASNPKIANHLSNAQTKLTQAQDDTNQKKYDMAIQKFYDAWYEAFMATESCPTGYWTELSGYQVVP